MLTCLLVVLLIEATQKFLKDATHADIGQSGNNQPVRVGLWFIGEVEGSVSDTLNNSEKAVAICQFASFSIKVETLQHLPDIRAEPIKVFYKIVV